MMLKNVILSLLLLTLAIISSCSYENETSIWTKGAEFIEIQQIFDDERFPNIVVATDGTIIATWGRRIYQIRRSEDGGATWGPIIKLAEPGFQGGGVIVDETSGDILTFVEERHPPSKLTVYRSSDYGLKWIEEDITLHPDVNGNIPSMHMNERGITLKYGPHAGRLIRPTRSYGKGNSPEFWESHYTNAIYSDDGGKTWHTSAPFPVYGTGEASLEELSDGRIYYNSRRHLSTDGLNPRMRYIAWSYDGGETWEDISVSDALPDGAQHVDYGLMAGLVRLPLDGYDILLFSNIDVPITHAEEEIPHNLRTTRRIRGTIWASFDGGETWPVKRLLEPGSFAYSSMTAGRIGTPSEGLIYLMYESDGTAKVARFNLAWVTNGRDWKEFLHK